MIGLEHYLTVAAALFVIGIFGIFLNRKNVIVILMSIELMLLAVNINLVAFSSYSGDLKNLMDYDTEEVNLVGTMANVGTWGSVFGACWPRHLCAISSILAV